MTDLRTLCAYGQIDDLRRQVISCAIAFEDANRRGDAYAHVDIEDLTADQAAEIEKADEDYNATKKTLFNVVSALKIEAARRGEAP